ncbi:MAG: cadherin-like beta sandwich domain-containing protein [Bacilli bacterium]|nr:cadherin-like beta sandwich domain-containing protein [Bacilli bacterium]
MKKTVKIIMSLIILFSVFTPFINTSKAMAERYTYAYINATDLSVRACPSTDCERIKHDEGKTIWLDRPRVVEVLATSGDWSQIRFNYWGFTYTGYVMNKYLGNKQTYTLNQDYANELRRKGFPESYVEALCKMHAVHPNWNFEVSRVDATLDEATNGEYSPINKNLISTTNKAQLSTDPGAYSNGVYTQFEPGWYAPSWETLRYYLDARNFLDDNSIFMFEQLSFNETQNASVVQNILNGSFMAGTYTYNGTQKSYAETFVEAGRTYGVSPVHLAARVLQEQGYKGSATTEMDGGDGKKYYNYFNFGASGSTLEQIVQGALTYAKNRNWDSPYASIMGGAKGIANGYITSGQDTVFYEKFNLVGSSRYWHQYMANIQAPYRECYTTYISYWKAGLTDLAFTFKIPVYKDMSAGTVIPTKSNNANLKELNYNTGILYPAFDSSITEYTLEVSSNTNSVDITGVKDDDKARVDGNGTVTLNGNETVKEIIVTAEDDTERKYTITIKKKSASEETTEDIIRYSGLSTKESNISGFEIGTSVENIINSIKNKNINVTVKLYDSSNKEITSGTISTGQKITINLNGLVKTFDVIVYGDTSGDGRISTLDYSKVKAHIQNTKALEGVFLTAADTSKDGRISTLDYSKIKAHIQNTQSLVQ